MTHSEYFFDFTPDPKVLIALTHTPMLPMDALCELVDNAIDSFQAAKLTGIKIENPLISIDLPKMADLNRGSGVIRVRDNGPGMTMDMAERSIKAGFSGNNPYDSLGLFGMGFNISTGKLGRVTKLLTARKGENSAIDVVIDLDYINQAKDYELPVFIVDKPKELLHGTIIEVSQWWPDGNANSQFVKRLVQYGLPKVRAELGRRYASLLSKREIRIVINGEPCEAFEHCVWDSSRFVERKGHGHIQARYDLDHVIGVQRRCGSCTALVPTDYIECPSCKSSSIRSVEERVRGWVGIQRFDDSTEFGIDLIRNGRAIRIAEKTAFFEYVDEFKKTIKDYPIDGPYGRIIGEVHLNHVPVDFLKQDFQRSSPEWQRAVSYLRGDSSLQPNQPGTDQNESFIYKLYQGFRRVRKPGKSDLYMGYWDKESNESKRISRDIEKEYYKKFLAKLPGYYDDSEWWRLVEQADTPPLEELVECPECSAQNLKEHDTCAVCGYVLIGKPCINPDCKREIPKSAQSCPLCGMSQMPKVEEPWTCHVCSTKNRATEKNCTSCNQEKGTENTISQEYLSKNSNKSDDLSIPGCSIRLADGTYSSPIDVNVYITQISIKANLQEEGIPLIIFKGEEIDIYLDKTHKVFKSYRIRPEQMIASEVALYIYDMNRRLSGRQYQGQHTLSNIEWKILNTRWADILEDDPEKIREEISAFFAQLREKLPELLKEMSADIFNEMPEEQKKAMVDNMLNLSIDISRLGDMKDNGDFLLYINQDTIIEIFKKYTPVFFDGGIWDVSYANLVELTGSIIQQAQIRIKNIYFNCLDDIANFSKYRSNETGIAQKTRLSLDYLQLKVVK
ncbi:ATP-binding protein [Paenibacillus sp. D2_2]|uniref:ATP-binding protein n=1 Tax=Paenibacillus sp. D2_2 TaxID=3073092 RepID=UPI0028158A04|nr:ATP-binding protein [Paenibacillus sp. D2_2]WMT41269.1 ATP-binding protein [Paenibacillus sp. D2_2]